MNEEKQKILERWNKPLTAEEVIERANQARLNAIKTHQKKSWFQRIFGRKIRFY